jgi:DNA-binding XRE family transcriptional regulator
VRWTRLAPSPASASDDRGVAGDVLDAISLAVRLHRLVDEHRVVVGVDTRQREWQVSQDDLSYEAGVSRSYLSQLEKGAFYASLKIVQRLATALNVSAVELLAAPTKGLRKSKSTD